MGIEEYLSSPESPRLEFKERLPSNDKLAALLCAFANSLGGDLIIGVEDRTLHVCGVLESEVLAMEEKIAAIAATNVSPILFPVIKTQRYGGAMLLQVHVDMGFQKPYRVVVGPDKGKVFVRIGSTTRQADSAAEEAMRLHSHGLSWDCLPCRNISVADLDKSLIGEFVDLRMQRRNIARPSRIDSSWLLKTRLGVIEGGTMYPTNGAVALFSKNAGEIFPSVCIEMARFAGTTGRDFIDKQTVTGPLWKLYDDALIFLRRNVTTSSKRTFDARQETVAYPEIAFREFLINALCHRNYEGTTGPVRCAIFDTVIQITNPGTFPEGLELKDIGTGVSVIRNPLIARIFNELGLIEGWGTGIQVAQQELSHHNLANAKIEQRGFFIQVTSPWRWPKDLSDREMAIVQEAAGKGSISSTAVAAMFKLTDRTARKILVKLVHKELLDKIGGTKGTVYRSK